MASLNNFVQPITNVEDSVPIAFNMISDKKVVATDKETQEEKSRKERRKEQRAEHKRFKSVVKLLRKEDFKTIRFVGNHRRFDFVIADGEGIKDYESLVNFHEDITALKDFANEHNILILKIKGLIKQKVMLETYKSDWLESSDVDFIESGCFFEKYDEQRIQNKGTDKMRDNFRYVVLRSANMADANFFPVGVCLDESGRVTFKCYDRSNLLEFCQKNLLKYHPNPQEIKCISEDDFLKIKNMEEDVITKSKLMSILEEVKQDYPTTWEKSIDFQVLYDRIVSDSAQTKYSVKDIIGSEMIDVLLNEFIPMTTVMAYSDVISKELENLNNKNNSWMPINFEFQKINTLTTRRISLTAEAKILLDSDEYQNVKKYFKNDIDNVPENILLPYLAFDVFNASNFRRSSDNIDFYESLCYLLESKSSSNGIGIKYLSKIYTMRDPNFSKGIVDNFYSPKVIDQFEKHFKKVKKLLKYLKSQGKKNKGSSEYQYNKLQNLFNRIQSVPVWMTLAGLIVGDDKTLKTEANVVELSKIVIDVYFGNSVFKENKDKTFKIIDTEFDKLIRQDGYSKSHAGRANYFLNKDKLDDIKDRYEKFVKKIGSNEQLMEIEAKTIVEAVKVTELYWYEKTPNGKFEKVGFTHNSDSDTFTFNDTTSCEHLKNDTHEVIVLRSLSNNSAEGAMTKPIEDKAGWYRHIAELQQKVGYVELYKDARGNSSPFTAAMVEHQLKQYSDYLDVQGV